MRLPHALVYAVIPVIALSGCSSLRDFTLGDSPSVAGSSANGSGYFPSSSGTGDALGCLVLGGVVVVGACLYYVGEQAAGPVLCWVRGERWPPRKPSPEEWIDAPVQFRAGAGAAAP
jgi:hypothetical protein